MKSTVPVQVLVLAAGQGRRFVASGGQGSKLAARLGDRSVLDHVRASVEASGLPLHIEEGPHAGMGECIAAAVRAHAQAGAWLILPGDLPLIRPDTLRQVAAAAPLDQLARALWRGEWGHPVRFPARFGPALMALRGDRGAAALLAGESVVGVAVEDPGCVRDVDSLADLRAMEAMLAARSPLGSRQ